MKLSASRYRWIALGLALFSQSSAAFVLQAPAPLAPLFQADLGLSKAEVGLLSAATSFGAWSMVLAGGLLADRLGIRRVMSTAVVLVGVFLLSMAVAGSFLHAVAVMFAAGLARGVVFPSSTKAVLEWFSLRSRATAMGIKQMGMPIAGIASASVLPTLGLALGWRSAIAIPGLLIVAIGIGTAVLYRSAADPSQLAASRVSTREALAQLLHNRSLLVLCFVGFSFLIVQLAVLTYLALYFTDVVLVSTIPDLSSRILAAGGCLAVCQVGGATGRVSWGLVSDKLFRGQRLVVLAFVGVMSCGMLLILRSLGPGLSLGLLSVVAFGCGAMVVGWNGVYNAVLTEIVGPKYAATGVGLAMTFSEVGTMAGPPLFGLVVDLTHSYQASWLFLAGVAAVGTLVAAMAAMRERQAQQASPALRA